MLHRISALLLAASALLWGCDSHGPADPAFDVPESASAPTASAIAGSAVNTSDSYVRGTLVVDFDATVTSDTPMYDAQTGTSSKTMTIDTPPARFDFELGYDAQGLLVYDQVALDPAGDPATTSSDEVRRVRVRNGRFEILTASGQPVTGGATLPTLQHVLGTSASEPLVLLDGMVPTQLPAQGSASTAGGATFRVASVSTTSSTSLVTTTTTYTDPATPDVSQLRTYKKTGGNWVLSEIRTDLAATTGATRISGRAALRFENVTWHRNTANDNARRAGAAPALTESGLDGSFNTPAPCDPMDERCEPSGGGGGGGGTSACALTPGASDIVYVHGFNSDGPAWGNPSAGTSSSGGVVGPIRCRLQIGSDTRPSLTQGGDKGLGSHVDQAAQLKSHVQGLSSPSPILVAHSQGGVIARRVAQSLPGRARAVVTTGTPHQGAPIARAVNPGPGANGIINTLSASASGALSCRLGGCAPVKASLIALRDGLGAALFASPAARDLRPGSAAIAQVNGASEPFPRYGIQHVIEKKWAFAQMAGDQMTPNQGPAIRAAVRDLFWVAVGTSVITGVISLVPGAAAFFGSVSTLSAKVAHHLHATDAWWTRITVGSESGDGFIPYSSQRYPGNGVINYMAPNSVSHSAEIDSERSSQSVQFVLQTHLNVPRR